MDSIIFAETWKKFFAGFGIESFDDFFNYSHGETVEKNSCRDVIAFDLDDGLLKKRFFIKRFLRSYFKDMLLAWRNFGKFYSQARFEWENTKLLFANGINTYKPVCYGERIKCGLQRKSFIVTEKLTGKALTDFVRQNWNNLNRRQKEEIIIGLAGFIRRIHKNKFCLPDLYVWHIFLKESQISNGWEFAVIDLHRMSHNITNRNYQIENLGRLFHSMRVSYFDEEIKRLYIKSYVGNDWTGSVNKLTKKVKKYSKKFSARRKLKPY